MSKQRQWFLLETIAVVIQAENLGPCRSGSLSCQGGSVNSRPPKSLLSPCYFVASCCFVTNTNKDFVSTLRFNNKFLKG